MVHLRFGNSQRLSKITALALAFLLAVNIFPYTATSAEDVYVFFRENSEASELNSDYFSDGTELVLTFDMDNTDTLRITVCSDNYGSDENSWQITNTNNGQIEYSGDAVSNTCDIFEDTLYSGSFRFTVSDDFGDGMGCPSDGCPTNSNDETYNVMIAKGDTILYNYQELSDTDGDLSPDTIEFSYEVDADCDTCTAIAVLNIDVYTYSRGDYSLVETITRDIEADGNADDGSSISWDVSGSSPDWDGPEYDLTFDIYLTDCNENNDNCGPGSQVQDFLVEFGEGAINEVNVIPFAIDAFEQNDYNDLVAEVRLDGAPLSDVSIRFVLDDGSVSQTYDTDDEGRAFFPNMQDGTWELSAIYNQINIDHESGSITLDQSWHNSGYNRTVLVMNEANDDDVFNIIFVYAAYISGDNEETEGINDVFVEIYTDEDRTVLLDSGYTEDGSFDAGDVERGNYYYDIYLDDSEDDVADLVQQGSVFVTGNSGSDNADDGEYEAPDGVYEASPMTLDIHDDGAVDDTIFMVCGIGEDGDCDPVANAKVTLTDSNADEISRRTDGTGEATFVNTAIGTYDYEVSHDSVVFDSGILKVGITNPRLGVITTYDSSSFIFAVCDSCHPDSGISTIDDAYVKIFDRDDNIIDEGYTDQSVEDNDTNNGQSVSVYMWWPRGATQVEDYFTYEIRKDSPTGALLGSGNLNNPTAPYYMPPEGILDSFSVLLDIDGTGENNDIVGRACGMFVGGEDPCYPVDGASITMVNGGGFTVVDGYTDEDGFFAALNLSNDVYDYELSYDDIIFDSGTFLVQTLGAGHLYSDVFEESIANDYGFYVCYSCDMPPGNSTTTDSAYVEIYHPDGSTIDSGYTDEELDSGITIFSWSFPEENAASYYDYKIYSDSDKTNTLTSGTINTDSEGDGGRDYVEYFESTSFYVEDMSVIAEFDPNTVGNVEVEVLAVLTAYNQEGGYVDSAYTTKTINAQDEDAFTLSIEFDDAGTYNFNLSLYDSSHDSKFEDSSLSTNIQVPDNEAPVIDNFQAPTLLDEGEDITFSITFSDEDGDNLDLELRVYRGSSLVAWDDSFSAGSGSYTYTWSANDNGDYTAVFTIEDDYQEDEVSHSFSVTNIAPTIDSITYTDNPSETQTVQFQVIASDASPIDTLTYTWAFDSNNPEDVVQGQNAERTYMKDGVYDVSLTVCDDDEGCSNELFQVTIANTPPTIHDVSFSTWLDDNFSFTFVMNASDPADNFTDYWDFGDGNTGGMPNIENNLVVSHTYDEPGTYTVTVEINDGDGGTDNFTVTVTVEDPNQFEDILGCTDVSADNYNHEATVDDGSCIEWTPPDDDNSEDSGGILEAIPALNSLFAISLLGLISILGGRRQV